MKGSIATGLAVISILILSLPHSALEGASLLEEITEIRTPGIAEAPVPSPDGRLLAYTTTGYRGLSVLDLDTGLTIQLSHDRGAGFHPVWSASGDALAFRTQTGGRLPKLRIVVARPDGETETASPLSRSLSLPFWCGETLGYYDFQGRAPALRTAGPRADTPFAQPPAVTPEGRLWVPGTSGLAASPLSPEKVFFLPVLSPDGRSFVVECLDGHLYRGDTAGGGLKDLGPGSYPSFVRGGRALLFERTEDDGHRLVAGDLFLMDLETGAVAALTETADRIERRPSMGPDGRTVYFEEGGKLWRGVTP